MLGSCVEGALRRLANSTQARRTEALMGPSPLISISSVTVADDISRIVVNRTVNSSITGLSGFSLSVSDNNSFRVRHK